jgi:hypothetical protein
LRALLERLRWASCVSRPSAGGMGPWSAFAATERRCRPRRRDSAGEVEAGDVEPDDHAGGGVARRAGDPRPRAVVLGGGGVGGPGRQRAGGVRERRLHRQQRVGVGPRRAGARGEGEEQREGAHWASLLLGPRRRRGGGAPHAPHHTLGEESACPCPCCGAIGLNATPTPTPHSRSYLLACVA